MASNVQNLPDSVARTAESAGRIPASRNRALPAKTPFKTLLRDSQTTQKSRTTPKIPQNDARSRVERQPRASEAPAEEAQRTGENAPARAEAASNTRKSEKSSNRAKSEARRSENDRAQQGAGDFSDAPSAEKAEPAASPLPSEAPTEEVTIDAGDVDDDSEQPRDEAPETAIQSPVSAELPPGLTAPAESSTTPSKSAAFTDEPGAGTDGQPSSPIEPTGNATSIAGPATKSGSPDSRLPPGTGADPIAADPNSTQEDPAEDPGESPDRSDSPIALHPEDAENTDETAESHRNSVQALSSEKSPTDVGAKATPSVSNTTEVVESGALKALNSIAGGTASSRPSVDAPTPTADRSFVEANHPTIVNGVRGQLLPHGGTMQIRLDPPELGALLVKVSIDHGVMNASFETSSPDATAALSHSLTQLKHALEQSGVSVDKLQVTQAPRNEKPETGTRDNNSQQQNSQSATDWQKHSDQQRKEMLKRMWAKLGVGDPLDLVA